MTLKVIKDINLIRTGCPKSDIYNKNLTKAFFPTGRGTVGFWPSVLASVVYVHDDAGSSEGPRHDLLGHGIIKAC